MLSNIASSLLLASTGLLPSFRQPYNTTEDPSPSDKAISTWDDLPASETLVYYDCFHDFQCAKLRVPMDWHAKDGANNKTVEIAIIRLPATVPITDTGYGGAVLMNPGGPGGSGVHLVQRAGKHFQTIVSAGPTADDRTSRHFDIIGFDPRGVRNTRPTLHCFPNYIDRLLFEDDVEGYGVPDSSDMAFTNIWTRVRSLADSCSKRAIEAGIGEHMSTTSVARDVMEIVERHGEWTEQEARRILGIFGSSEEDLPDHVKYQPGKEPVQYWGISYGTVLGATLSDMYPDRVGRVVLDGVVDSFDYYNGDWTTNLLDTDREIPRFAEYCWLSGPDNCTLYHEDGPDAIVQRFDNITQNLLSNLIAVPATQYFPGDLATYGDLKGLFSKVAYSPLTGFDPLSEAMAQLEKGNGTVLVEPRRVSNLRFQQRLSKSCEKDGPYSHACDPFYDGGALSIISAAVLCSDAKDQTTMTKEEYWRYTKDMMKQSRMLGDGLMNKLPCTQWHARAKWQFEGDLNATTAHPILFLGNAIDPITPLRNAYKMSKGFSGSVVLALDIEGHGSSSGISFCATKAVRNYFQTGELPEVNTTCSPDRHPLDGYVREDKPALPRGETDEELWKAMTGLTGKGQVGGSRWMLV